MTRTGRQRRTETYLNCYVALKPSPGTTGSIWKSTAIAGARLESGCLARAVGDTFNPVSVAWKIFDQLPPPPPPVAPEPRFVRAGGQTYPVSEHAWNTITRQFRQDGYAPMTGDTLDLDDDDSDAVSEVALHSGLFFRVGTKKGV